MAAQPGQQLPISPHPPVQPGKIGGNFIGVAIGQLHILQQPGMEIGTLQQVMGKDPFLGKTPGQALEKNIYVKDPFSGIGPPVKEIVIYVTAGSSVGVDSPLPREDTGKLRVVGRLQIHRDPGLQQPIALDNDPSFPIYPRLIQRMEHRPHQPPCCPYTERSIRVQRDDIFCPRQVSGGSGQHTKSGGLSPKESRQFQKRPPFSFPPHIPLIPFLKNGLPKEKVESTSILVIQLLNGLFSRFYPFVLLDPHGGPPVREIGQKAKPELLSAVAVG